MDQNRALIPLRLTLLYQVGETEDYYELNRGLADLATLLCQRIDAKYSIELGLAPDGGIDLVLTQRHRTNPIGIYITIYQEEIFINTSLASAGRELQLEHAVDLNEAAPIDATVARILQAITRVDSLSTR